MLHRHALILSRGDPGLLSVFKRLGRTAVAFATGGPLAASRALLASTQRARASVPQFPSLSGVPRPSGGVLPQLSLAGVGAVPRGPSPRLSQQVAQPLTTGGCESGFHPNKSSYYTKEGFVEQGTKCVRNRRRNLSNGRANARSLRRLAAWDKQERKRIALLRRIARK